MARRKKSTETNEIEIMEKPKEAPKKEPKEDHKKEIPEQIESALFSENPEFDPYEKAHMEMNKKK